MADSELAVLLQSAEGGTSKDRERLFAAMYAQLHRLAQRELRRNVAATLSPTTLLHETYLSLSRLNTSATFPDRAKFMSYAARAMRGLLIDYLRNRRAQKRGGEFQITSLSAELPDVPDSEFEKLAAAIDSLALVDPRLAECVDLKFFCGLSNDDIAQLWDVSERTVRREWDKARLLLHDFLT